MISFNPFDSPTHKWRVAEIQGLQDPSRLTEIAEHHRVIARSELAHALEELREIESPTADTPIERWEFVLAEVFASEYFPRTALSDLAFARSLSVAQRHPSKPGNKLRRRAAK